MALRPAGGAEGGQCRLDASAGQVSPEEVSQLGAGEPFGGGAQRIVDLLGDGIGRRGAKRLGGRAGCVVPQRQGGMQVGGVDDALAIDEPKEHRKTQDMGFCAGAQGADEPLGRLREPGVGVVPLEPGSGVEGDLATSSCTGEVGAEALLQPGPGQRVGVPAVGEESVPATGDEAEAAQEPVGRFDGARVVGELSSGDVADDTMWAAVARAGAVRGATCGLRSTACTS